MNLEELRHREVILLQAGPCPLPAPDVPQRLCGAAENPAGLNQPFGRDWAEPVAAPRAPGRDYAGTVVEGSADWIGAQVWGTGGVFGYAINGSHAERIAVPVASLRHKPGTLSLEQAQL